MLIWKTLVQKKYGLLLAGVLLLALLLRLYGIRFGLPYLYHYDESVYTGAALNLGAGQVGVQVNPTGMTNILFFEYALYFMVGKLAGIFPNAASFGASYHADPSNFILLARLTSAAFGVLTVMGVYWLGKSWRSAQVGLLSALLAAVAFLHVRDSHFGVPDITATFFTTGSVLMCLLSVRQRRPLFLWLAFFCAAFATMVKWSVWPVFIPALLSLVDLWRERRPAPAWRRGKLLGYSLLAALLGLLLGGFQMLLAPATYLAYVAHEMGAGQSGGFWIWQVDTLPGWLFYIKVMAQGLGILHAALILLAIPLRLVAAVRGRNAADLILLSFPVAYFLIMGATRHYFARYLLPFLPFGILFSVDLLSQARLWLENRSRRAARVGFILAVIALLIQPSLSSVRLGYLLNQVDTRALAHDWIDAHIQPGARIGVDAPFLGPPLSTARQTVPNSSKTFEVIYFDAQSGLSARSLDWYRQQQFNYLIASSFIYNIPLNDPDGNLKRQAFYQSLDRDLEQVSVFAPRLTQAAGAAGPGFVFDEIYAPLVSLWERDQPGPVLKIYRIQ